MDTKISESLRKIREEHMLTQEALAEALHIEPIWVYRMEAARIPIEREVLAVLADFYGITINQLIDYTPEDKNKPAKPEQISFKCKMCGGDLVFNYKDGICQCANCGKKWNIAEQYPKYARVMTYISKAGRILKTGKVLASAAEAKFLFTQALDECFRYNDVIAAELIKICYDGQKEAEKLEIYCRGKHFFENRAYRSALRELEKIRGYRDADDMISRCKGKP